MPKKNNPEAIAYLRLIPSARASGLLVEKGNIVSVISLAKTMKLMLSRIIIIPINAKVNLELLNKIAPIYQ